MNTKQLGKIYEKIVGYNIHIESHDLSSEEIIKIMKEYDLESGDNSFKNYGCY